VKALGLLEQTVATVESLTGGLIASTLVEIPGVSAVYRGGLVVYATDLKHSLAGVDQALLTERGPVDPDVAVALAAGARERCGADWAVSTTGVAGPDPQDGKPVGLVYTGVAGPFATSVRELRLSGGRAEIRAMAVTAALAHLADELRRSGPGITAGPPELSRAGESA
jgi:nicotinamide-nucleotide amidase